MVVELDQPCETCFAILQAGHRSRNNKRVWREEYLYHLTLAHKIELSVMFDGSPQVGEHFYLAK
jgi:hypothetical protein